MTEKRRDRGLAQTETVLRRMVDRGCLAEADRNFILRAAGNANDPEHALGFAAIPMHTDPSNSKHLPIRDIIDTLVEQERPFFLKWPRDRWRRKWQQLQRLREFTPLPPRYERVGWLVRCLPSDRRLRILDSPSRLLRESIRQGFPLLQLERQLQRGCLGGVSVLTADKKRWTVVLHVPSGSRRSRVHSILGADGVEPDERARATIADVLGRGIDMTRPSRRAWRSAGQGTIAGLGAALLLMLAPIERPRPEVILSAAGVVAAGAGCCAIRQALSESVRWSRWLSAAIFAVVWLGPGAAAAVAIDDSIPITAEQFATAEPVGSQLFWLPTGYLAAALAWPPIRRWWHTRPGRPGRRRRCVETADEPVSGRDERQQKEVAHPKSEKAPFVGPSWREIRSFLAACGCPP